MKGQESDESWGEVSEALMGQVLGSKTVQDLALKLG
jgi:hypothetical protein